MQKLHLSAKENFEENKNASLTLSKMVKNTKKHSSPILQKCI